MFSSLLLSVIIHSSSNQKRCDGAENFWPALDTVIETLTTAVTNHQVFAGQEQDLDGSIVAHTTGDLRLKPIILSSQRVYV